MSETTETKAVTSTKAKGEIGPSMLGSEILVKALEGEGVDTLFAYPGGASMELHQALTRSKQIRTILPRHEQGGSFAAEGYARATGKAGVCMATSGPGATNLVTGIADAYMDSIPLVAVTGQVPQAMIGKGGFQETDFYGLTLPVVKHSYLVTDVNEIPVVVKEAFKIATSGRPGPVVIDVPKNIQQTRAQVFFPAEVDIAGFDPENRKASELELNEIIGLRSINVSLLRSIKRLCTKQSGVFISYLAQWSSHFLLDRHDGFRRSWFKGFYCLRALISQFRTNIRGRGLALLRHLMQRVSISTRTSWNLPRFF